MTFDRWFEKHMDHIDAKMYAGDMWDDAWNAALEAAAKMACPYGDRVTPWEAEEISASRIIADAIRTLKETP